MFISRKNDLEIVLEVMGQSFGAQVFKRSGFRDLQFTSF